MVNNSSVDGLVNCIKKLHIDRTLFLENQNRAIKFDFEQMETAPAKNLAIKILQRIFNKQSFWICEYGEDSRGRFKKKGFFSTPFPDIKIVPYISLVDKDFADYAHDTIVCTYISWENFQPAIYVSYAFRKWFLSNSVFLIDDKREIAVYIYDRRGMDVVSSDKVFLKEVYIEFEQYIIQYHKENIRRAIMGDIEA